MSNDDRIGHRYRGHRAESFFASDLNELVEIRARQRTFYGAYFRTALGNLGYALTILRLFDSRFYRIGLLFTILGALLFVLSFLRDRHSRHDFADTQGTKISPEPSHISYIYPDSHVPGDIIRTVGQKVLYVSMCPIRRDSQIAPISPQAPKALPLTLGL
ncbi:hypothetical protein LENED_004750 [Lentinula edodes]|uniref:DUF202 domain-containing protein n=1 Tax=Lentinula edodes TaxID=5353 RepID=A0A1Q3E763_LENED|nr:hypothetical protein LENED_004750 [Lentinula edodes]